MEPVKQHANYAQTRREVESWFGIDPGVLDLVVALRTLGFPTHMSCEGHLDGGTFWPWVASPGVV
jgi:hypothetical protein